MTATTNEKKPTTLTVNLDGIPAELKAEPRWVAWRLVQRGAKWTKTPLQIANGHNAKSNDPSTWAPFTSAASSATGGRHDGIGFMLGGGFAGVDLDRCVDPETHAIEPWARDILSRFSTYAEISPSGRGVKVFCRGSLPDGMTGRRKGPIEVYGAGRYFCVTGRPWNGALPALVDCSKALASLCEELGHGGEDTAEPTKPANYDPLDNEIVQLASEAANGAKFRALWSGDASGYASESEADLALASILAFWCRRDASRVERLMRQSGLKRAKWDAHKTYLSDTIAHAVETTLEVYGDRGPTAAHVNREKTSGDDISNVMIVDQDGDKPTVTPRPMSEVLATIRKRSGNWPRRVDNALFVDEVGTIRWLNRPAALFGWLADRFGIIDWRRSSGCVSKDETYAEMQGTSPKYAGIETLPHEPLLPSHYYTCENIPPGDGSTLARLLDFFTPATPIDRQLTIALAATLGWGGPPGARPAGLITSQTGRGKGKTQLAQKLSRLWGGSLDISSTEEIAVIKQRLLSPEAVSIRVALLDNVKTTRFSWAELEALITRDVISGKRMYVGDATRPNYLTWLITLNGASLSTDMAQRVVEVRLADPEYRDTWEAEVTAFIDANRMAIIGDLISFLRRPPKRLQRCSRWAMWECEVLARLDNPDECLDVILERRGQVDVEQEEGGIIEDFFAGKLKWLGYDIETQDVFIGNAIATRWYNEATNDRRKTTGVTRALKQLYDEGRIGRILPCRSVDLARARGFRWIGDHCDSMVTMRMDLGHRLAEKDDQKKGDQHKSQSTEDSEHGDF